jgi:ABC-type lipoprotein export system ATPase subunit
MSEPVLSCENLAYWEEGSCLFSEVSFRLDAGKRGVVLAEPHRCATTLLKICATLISPASGEIRWFGHSAKQMNEQELLRLRRRIGLVHRQSSLVSNMTILDNISLGLQYHDEIIKEQAHESVQDLLKRFGLYEYRLSRPHELTFEQRRLAVYTRELAKKPQLFLLESPSLDLGGRAYNLLLDFFQGTDMNAGCCFLVASTKPQVVKFWGDWVLIFDEGRCKRLEASQFNHTAYRESVRLGDTQQLFKMGD